MCFTPPVSLATAAIEFGLIFWMQYKYPRAAFLTFGCWFMFLLGAYQFSEFLLCVAPYPDIWVRLGFIAYSFLPAVGLHAALVFTKKKYSRTLLYAIPVLASLFVLTPHAAVSGVCETIFVTTHIFPNSWAGSILFWIYSGFYYAGFIIWSSLVCLHKYLHEKNVRRRTQFLFLSVAIALMTIPTMILIIILPHFDVRFPSILCHFALLLAITIFLGVRYENKFTLEK